MLGDQNGRPSRRDAGFVAPPRSPKERSPRPRRAKSAGHESRNDSQPSCGCFRFYHSRPETIAPRRAPAAAPTSRGGAAPAQPPRLRGCSLSGSSEQVEYTRSPPGAEGLQRVPQKRGLPAVQIGQISGRKRHLISGFRPASPSPSTAIHQDPVETAAPAAAAAYHPKPPGRLRDRAARAIGCKCKIAGHRAHSRFERLRRLIARRRAQSRKAVSRLQFEAAARMDCEPMSWKRVPAGGNPHILLRLFERPPVLMARAASDPVDAVPNARAATPDRKAPPRAWATPPARGPVCAAPHTIPRRPTGCAPLHSLPERLRPRGGGGMRQELSEMTIRSSGCERRDGECGACRQLERAPGSAPRARWSFPGPEWLLERLGRHSRIQRAARAIRTGALEEPQKCRVSAAGTRFQDIGSQSSRAAARTGAGTHFPRFCARRRANKRRRRSKRECARGLQIALHRLPELRGLAVDLVVLMVRGRCSLARRFDPILVDAPCSGTGTLGRNPEIQWLFAGGGSDPNLHRPASTALLRNRSWRPSRRGGLLVLFHLLTGTGREQPA